MPTIDQHALYELDILRHVEQSSRLNNRQASSKLGVSVKLAHELLRRMVEKGLLHVKVVHARRWDYFLTPKGIAEKTRLTVEFFDFSMSFYREARRRSAQLCRDLAEQGFRRVAFLGANDLAEITYLGVQEWGLFLDAVYDMPEAAGVKPRQFLNIPVQPLAAIGSHDTQAVIVCLYDAQMPMRERYLPEAIAQRPDMHWIFDLAPQSRATKGHF